MIHCFVAKQLCARRAIQGLDEAKAILFRSKIGKPLSPQTPAVHIDWLLASDEDERALGESEICINLYDITHRLEIIDSQWLQTLFAVISLENTKDGDLATENKTTDTVTKVSLIRIN